MISIFLKKHKILASIILIYIFSSTIYTLCTDDMHDIMLHTFYISIFVSIIILGFFIETFFFDSKRKLSERDAADLIFLLFLLFAIFLESFILYVLYIFTSYVITLISNNASHFLTILYKYNHVTMIIFFTLFFGIFLYIFKIKFRLIYGVTELVVGLIVSAIRTIQEPMDQFLIDYKFHLAILTAGIYLVVRGIDNIYEGYKEESKDVLTAFIIEIVSPVKISKTIRSIVKDFLYNFLKKNDRREF